MSLGAYLRGHAAQIALVALGGALACAAAWVGGASRDAVALAAVLCALGLAAAVAAGWARTRRLLSDLATLPRQLDHAWQLPTMLDEPAGPEGAVVYDAMCEMGRSAADDLAEARRQTSEYREYVEAWIHEVKAPIAAASLAAGRVAGEDGAIVRRELDRISAQVDQALWYARSTAVASDYSIREVALADVVRSVLRDEARLLIEAGVAPRVEVGEDVVVFTDAKWAAFVIAQAVTNSAKYGAHELRVSCREEGEGADARTVLEIADDGCGIPEADVPRVFERGFTGQNGRRVGSSTGMGLYLAAIMCERLGLGIRLGSREGAGTRVMLSFPHDRRRLDMALATPSACDDANLTNS